jgi:hypothetical protein
VSLLAAGQGAEAPTGVNQTLTSEEIVRVIQVLTRDMRVEGLPGIGEPGAVESGKVDETASP